MPSILSRLDSKLYIIPTHTGNPDKAQHAPVEVRPYSASPHASFVDKSRVGVWK